MAVRKRFSFKGFAMVLRSGLLPWNEPAHPKVRQCTVPIRAWLTSDLTEREVHEASSAAMPGTMIQARIRCLTMSVTSSERVLSPTDVRPLMPSNAGAHVRLTRRVADHRRQPETGPQRVSRCRGVAWERRQPRA